MGGSPKLAPNSILMVLVDLDVHQIVGYHYFDHHQPSSSPQDVDRGREKPFPVGGHRAELAGALFGGRKFSLIYSPMSGFTS